MGLVQFDPPRPAHVRIEQRAKQARRVKPPGTEPGDVPGPRHHGSRAAIADHTEALNGR